MSQLTNTTGGNAAAGRGVSDEAVKAVAKAVSDMFNDGSARSAAEIARVAVEAATRTLEGEGIFLTLHQTQRREARYREALERIAGTGPAAHRAYYGFTDDPGWGIAGTLTAAQRIARAALDGEEPT